MISVQEAHAKILAKQPLTPEERALVKWSLANAIDLLLLTGSGQSMLSAFGQSSVQRNKLPVSSSPRVLHGMYRLDFYGNDSSDVLEAVISEMTALVRVDGDRSSLPWLLQGVQFGYPWVRERVYKALSSINLSDAEVSTTVQNLLTSIVAQGEGFAEEASELTSDAAREGSDGRWTLALLAGLARFPSRKLNTIWQELSYEGLEWAAKLDFPDFQAVDVPAFLDRRELALVQTALYTLIRRGDDLSSHMTVLWKNISRALDELASKTSRSGSPLRKLEKLIPRLMGMVVNVVAIENILELLNHGRGLLPVDLLPEARDIVEKLKPCRDAEGVEEIYDHLRVLVANSTPRSPVEESTIDGMNIVKIPFTIYAGYQVAPGIYAFPFKKLLYVTSGDSWMTNEDGFGVLLVDRAGRVEEIALPVVFPVQATGASGAIRDLEPICLLGDELLLNVESPFSDNTGWGRRNYLFGFQIAARKWFYVSASEKKDGSTQRFHVEPGMREEQLKSFANAELKAEIIDGKLQLLNDLTPYHLDSYEGVHREAVPFNPQSEDAKGPFESNHVVVTVPTPIGPRHRKVNTFPDWAKPAMQDVEKYILKRYSNWTSLPPISWQSNDDVCVALCPGLGVLIFKRST